MMKPLLCHQFLRLLAEESSEISEEAADKELALKNSIEAMSLSMEKTLADYKSKKEKQREYENSCREKFSTPDKKLESESGKNHIPNNSQEEINVITSIVEEAHVQSIFESDGKPLEEVTMLSYPRKLTVLHELLTACLADTEEDNKKPTRRRKGYDARHRIALRLLSTWFDVKWIKMVFFYICYVISFNSISCLCSQLVFGISYSSGSFLGHCYMNCKLLCIEFNALHYP